MAEEGVPSSLTEMQGEPLVYEPVKVHWFNNQQVNDKDNWLPFSLVDSQRLEEAFTQAGAIKQEEGDQKKVVVPVEGRRFDVHLRERRRHAVYWEQPATEVRRCSWFHKKEKDLSFTPFPEDISLVLEEAYMISVSCDDWQRRLDFPTGETVVLHNPKLMRHYPPNSSRNGQTAFSSFDQTQARVVLRGLKDLVVEVPTDEPDRVDHMVIMVHGIGAGCDLQMRGIVQCVNDFRSASLSLLSSHFKETGAIGRVEFLPVNWHRVLHGDSTGVDKDMERITLPSISYLRQFSNSTILDLFFYNSPTYCQTIADTVASEVNRLYHIFLQRHPHFTGEVSLVGHSLGSLILFDLLTNQNKSQLDLKTKQRCESRPNEKASSAESSNHTESLEDVLRSEGLEEFVSLLQREKMDAQSLLLCSETDLKELGIPLGPRKKIMCLTKKWQLTEKYKTGSSVSSPSSGSLGQPAEHLSLQSEGPSTSAVDYKHFDVGIGQVSIVYPQLAFHPQSFFALGSPIGMFLTVRGLRRIDPSYSLPTCRSFYNIYHPFDPVAYRIEPMVCPPGKELPAVMIPHHKGRKRMHLELKDSLTRVSSDLLVSFGALRSVWNTLTAVPTATPPPVAEEGNAVSKSESQDESDSRSASPPEMSERAAAVVGMLNGGRRFDYVLQEKPIECFNEYLFALQSHLCYWDSPDTALFVLKEIYDSKPNQDQT